MLSLIGIGRFGGDTDNFIHQEIADFLAHFPAENLSLGLAIHIPEIGHHLPIVLNSVFQQGSLVIDQYHQVFSIKCWEFFRLGTGQSVQFFEDTSETIGFCRENLTAEHQ